jgi:hypothetical protein
MRRPILRPGAFANVTAILALVVATGGTTAYAATMITSHQIKNGTIRAVDLHAGAVTSAKVRDGDLLRSDFAAGQLTPSRAYVVRHDGAVDISPIPVTTVLTLQIPQGGSYVISASTWVDDQSTTTETIVYCELLAGDDTDLKHSSLGVLGSGLNYQSQALQTAHAFAGPSSVMLACGGSGVASTANGSRIAAIAVDQLTSTIG